jgi:hypothetical protein
LLFPLLRSHSHELSKLSYLNRQLSTFDLSFLSSNNLQLNKRVCLLKPLNVKKVLRAVAISPNNKARNSKADLSSNSKENAPNKGKNKVSNKSSNKASNPRQLARLLTSIDSPAMELVSGECLLVKVERGSRLAHVPLPR